MRATTVENKWEQNSPFDYENGILPNGERMKTFHTWKLTFISLSQMEKAGFYSFEKEDLLKCLYCDDDCESLIIGPIPPQGETPQGHIFKEILCMFN